jgi:hypothetical protein
MTLFNKIKSDNDIKGFIKSIFDMDLSLDGSWGYSQELATIIKQKTDTTIVQLEHSIALMRTYIEMNVTLEKENRYAGISLNETLREEYSYNNLIYHKVTYNITAIKEMEYNIFINEYKANYGNKDFNISNHFDKRKKATLNRTETYWFEVSKIL